MNDLIDRKPLDSKPVKIGVRMVNVKAKRKARAHAKRVKAQKRHMAA